MECLYILSFQGLNLIKTKQLITAAKKAAVKIVELDFMSRQYIPEHIPLYEVLTSIHSPLV